MQLDDLLALLVSQAHALIPLELLDQIRQVVERVLHELGASNLHLVLATFSSKRFMHQLAH